MWHNHINYASWVGIQLPFEGNVSLNDKKTTFQKLWLLLLVLQPMMCSPPHFFSPVADLLGYIIFFFFTTHPWILVWDQCHAPKHLVERHIFAFRQTFYPEFSTRLAPSNLHGTPKWDPEDNSSIGNSKVCQFRVFFKGCTSPFVDKHQLVSLPFFTSFLSELAVSLHFMLFKIAQNWIWIRYPQNMTRSLKMIPWSYPKPPDLPS